jgi:hypothetical protein
MSVFKSEHIARGLLPYKPPASGVSIEVRAAQTRNHYCAEGMKFDGHERLVSAATLRD